MKRDVSEIKVYLPIYHSEGNVIPKGIDSVSSFNLGNSFYKWIIFMLRKYITAKYVSIKLFTK